MDMHRDLDLRPPPLLTIEDRHGNRRNTPPTQGYSRRRGRGTGRPSRASSDDVEAVAAELDIAPEFVEQAIQGWRKATGIGATGTGQSKIVQRRKRTMRIVLATGVVVIGGTAAAAVGGVALFGLTGLLTVGAIGIMGLGFLVWLIS